MSCTTTRARAAVWVMLASLVISPITVRAVDATPAGTAETVSTPYARIGGGSGRIAFVSTRDGVHGIYLLDVAEAVRTGGTNVATRLTDYTGPSVDPTWSPDGRQIAYRHLDPGAAASNLYVMDADGGNPRLLIRGGGSPAWSPDGATIAYAALGASGALGIALLDVAAALDDPEGVAPVLLTRPSGAPPEEYPVWSPDGSRLCFASYRDGNWEIYVMNADGSGQRNLTNSPALEYGCAWSADGTRIAFDSDRGGESGVYVVNADGSGLAELTGSGGGAGPVWSPDGTKIAFTSLRDGQPYAAEIYIMNADGTEPVRLTRSVDNDAFPAWQPTERGR